MQPQSKRLISCPSDELLLKYGRKELSDEQYLAVSSHLLFCDICLEYLNLLAQHGSEDTGTGAKSANQLVPEPPLNASLTNSVERFRSRQQHRQIHPKPLEEFQREGRELRVGQIWRPKSKGVVVPSLDGEQVFSVAELDSRPHLVVITNAASVEEEIGETKYHVIRVVPIDVNSDCIADDDLLVNEAESPLGYAFLPQTWNEQVMLLENLECLLGEFNETQHAAVIERLKLIGEGEYREGDFSLEAIIMKGLYSNPVMRYRAREYEETAYLRTPVDSIRSPYEGLEKYSDQQDEHTAISKEERADIIYEILRGAGVSEAVWSGGWKPYAASASEGARKPQTFWNADKSLSATLESIGKKMLLRIESSDKRWEGALVPFSWKSVVDTASDSRCIFAILAKDEVKRGTYVAEIELGELREIEGTILPDTTFSLTDLQASMADVIHESIMRALSNHELDAWKELSEREGLDPQVRAVIQDEFNDD
jgi:hypothetical protein